jgi:ribosome-associated protein
MNLELLRDSIRNKVSIEFARSGGPGGQNVNKVNSKVIARIKLDEVEGLSAAEADYARTRLSRRLTKEGELVIQADEERDQTRNREAAIARLAALISAAAKIPKRRKATRPTQASKEQRLASKRLRSESKRLRRPPEC